MIMMNSLVHSDKSEWNSLEKKTSKSSLVSINTIIFEYCIATQMMIPDVCILELGTGHDPNTSRTVRVRFVFGHVRELPNIITNVFPNNERTEKFGKSRKNSFEKKCFNFSFVAQHSLKKFLIRKRIENSSVAPYISFSTDIVYSVSVTVSLRRLMDDFPNVIEWVRKSKE